MKIAAVPTVSTDQQSAPSAIPKQRRPWNRKKQPCKKCQQANCRNGDLCGNDHTLSPSVDLSDCLDLEFRHLLLLISRTRLLSLLG